MSSPGSGVAELESVIGHVFRDPTLLLRALTHSSRIPERASDDPQEDNEKLEFLGDAVLELLVSEQLVRSFPDWEEGQLSKSRARLVNATALSLAAQRLGLGYHLLLGRGEEKTGGRSKPALLANAFEALVAAIYLDAGLDAARAFVQRSLVETAIAVEAHHLDRPDHKSALQEYLQARGLAAGTYHVVEETGPEHEKIFRVEVRVSIDTARENSGDLPGGIIASGTGKTKKEAEQLAAVAALAQLDAGRDQGSGNDG